MFPVSDASDAASAYGKHGAEVDGADNRGRAMEIRLYARKPSLRLHDLGYHQLLTFFLCVPILDE